MKFAAFWAIWALLGPATLAQAQTVFKVKENVPKGTFVGQIEATGPFLIVPLDQDQNGLEQDFLVNANSGEIRTRTLLDRESKDSYQFSAISLNGQSIQVKIQVIDVNDNGPKFAQNHFDIGNIRI